MELPGGDYMSNNFEKASKLSVGDKTYTYFSMADLGVEKLPYCL